MAISAGADLLVGEARRLLSVGGDGYLHEPPLGIAYQLDRLVGNGRLQQGEMPVLGHGEAVRPDHPVHGIRTQSPETALMRMLS